MKRSVALIISLVAAGVLLLAINVIASLGLRSAKVDMTQEKLYTLSEGSKQLLSKLDDKITLKFFYSKRAASGVPQIKQYADRIVELLKQYEQASGKITVEQLEPRPDTEIEEWAIKYGLQGINLMGGEPIYMGLVMVSEIGDQEVIPFLSPEREGFLEYDITRLISSLGTTERKTIGIMSALDVMGNADDPMARYSGQQPKPAWAIVSELKKNYDVKKVEVTAETIDPSINLLMVIHPKELSDQAQYAIDQYVLGGGHVIVMVDPMCLTEQFNFQSPNPQMRFQASFDSNLPKLLNAWGLEMTAGKVVGDLDLATMLNMGNAPAKVPSVLSITDQQCNQQEIMSSDMESMLFAAPGELKQLADEAPEGLTITPLVSTSARAGLLDAMMLKFNPDPAQMARDLKIEDKPLNLAVKISGKFKTAFPEGKPKAEPKEGEDPAAAQGLEGPQPTLTESTEDGLVVVVSDVDLVSDDFSVRKQNFFGQTLMQMLNDNLAFVTNTAENLMGAKELISLRTRGKSDRPFVKVDQIERSAQEQWKGREEELNKKLEETSQRISQLEQGKDENARSVLSSSQMKEVQKFREEQAKTKKELREVRRNLREDIEALGFKLGFLNIALMPLLVLLAGFIPVVWRHVRSAK